MQPVAGRFPDGQIVLPLHAHTPGQRPVDPADALASLDTLPPDEATQLLARLAAPAWPPPGGISRLSTTST